MSLSNVEDGGNFSIVSNTYFTKFITRYYTVADGGRYFTIIPETAEKGGYLRCVCPCHKSLYNILPILPLTIVY